MQRQDTLSTPTPHSIEVTSPIWQRLAASLPIDAIAWRQDGKPIARHGRYFARYVCYIEANTVRERLDSVIPGEWDLTLELLPSPTGTDESETPYAFKARLQVLGVIREDVGAGRDYKQAATDAFKRAAVRFGIGHELYAYEQNWVEMESDEKSAKPVEDPQESYERRYGRHTHQLPTGTVATEQVIALSVESGVADAVRCPKCSGRMWDNRLTKRNPKAPDYRCRNRDCDGVIWPSEPADTADDIHDTNVAA